MPKAKNEKTDRAQALYRSGWKLVDIAKELNVPPGTVRRWKCTYKWDESQVIDAFGDVGPCKGKLVCDLIKSGWKQVEIAEVLGMHPETVWRWKDDFLRADADREVMEYRRKVQSRKTETTTAKN